MFGSLGGAELLIILVLALLLFGPRKLPEIGRTIGKGLTEFRKATSEFKANLEREVDLKDVKDARDTLTEAKREIRSTIDEARRFDAPSAEPKPTPAGSPEAEPGPEAEPVPETEAVSEAEPTPEPESATEPERPTEPDASERRST